MSTRAHLSSIPTGFWVILGAFTFSAAIVLSRVFPVISSYRGDAFPQYVVFILVVAIATILPSAAAVILVFFGVRGAALVTTAAGILHAVEILYGVDVLSIVVVALSVLAIFAVWTPSIRRYMVERRTYRTKRQI
jgi:hypothetical protein